FSNTSQPWRTASNPPFCVQRCVNSHARSSLAKSIPARSRTLAVFVAVRQPPALSGGGKYPLAPALGKVRKSSHKNTASELRNADEPGELKYRRKTRSPPPNQ